MTEKRKAVVELEVEASGEAREIRNVGDEIEDLGRVADSADDHVSDLGDEVEDLGEKARKAQKEIDETRRRLDDLKNGKTPVVDIEQAILGMVSSLSKGTAGWNDFLRKMAEANKEAAEFFAAKYGTGRSGGLNVLLEQVKQSVLEVGDAAAEGGDGLEEMAVRARLKIERLKTEVEELKAAGQGMTDTQERELEEIQREYRETIKLIGRYKAMQAEVAHESSRAQAKAEGLSARVTDLGDAFSQLDPRLAKAVGVFASVTAGWTAGYAAGSQIMELMRGLDEHLGTRLIPSIREFTQASHEIGPLTLPGLQAVADWWFDVAPSAADEAREWNQVMQQLRTEGLEPLAGGSLEDLRQQLEDYRRTVGHAAMATSDLQRKTEEWAKGLAISAKDIEKQSKHLGDVLSEYLASAGDDVDWVAVSERIAGQLSEALSTMEILGVDADEHLRFQIEELFRRLEMSLQEAADGLSPPELESKIREPLRRLIDAFQGADPEVRAALEKLGAHWGVVSSEAQAHLDKVKGYLDKYVQDANQALGKVQRDLSNPTAQRDALEEYFAGLTPEKIQERMSEITEAERKAYQEHIKEMVALYKELGGEYDAHIQTVTAYTGVNVAGWESVGEAASQSAGQVKKHGEAQQGIQEVATETGRLFSNIGQSIRDAGGEVEKGSEQIAKSGGKIKDGTEEGKKALEDQGKAAAKAGEDLGEAASKADELASAEERMAEQTDKVKDSLGQIGESLADFDTKISGLPAKIEEAFAGVPAQIEPVKTSISDLRTEVQGLMGDLDALVEKHAQAQSQGATE